ncbi:MAG: right-handed parallel beta-helix repeat-containing protein [Thermodesulfobacteriota bacterium]|nr:right-handed parallel beta-helix repeat-containing protein [Thermodesulfobacteriota bacterium]
MNRHSLCRFLVFLFLFSSSAFGAEIHVPADRPTIQAGIDEASAGDVVLVADGVYTGSGNKNLDFHGKAITVESENGPWDCVIDCQGEGRGFIFQSGEGQDSVLAGIALVNGSAEGYPDAVNGGGIFCKSSSSPTIAYCLVVGNTAVYGGGIHCKDHSSPTITSCIIYWNTGNREGGGIGCEQYCTPTITDCNISENYSRQRGGGIHCFLSSPAITNCIISHNSNSSDGGAGIYCSKSSPTITNCTIVSNIANWGSGGIRCWYEASPIISNCILWDNYPGEISTGWYSEPIVTYCDIKGGYEGEGNIDEDPMFEDPDNGSFYLLPGSPCIDTGDNGAVPAGILEDIEGEPRVFDGDNNGTATVDMGADEYVDTDWDLLPDYLEKMTCTDPLDADTDDDGLLDGEEDSNQSGDRDYWGETDPCKIDTDDDGIQDGTESGLTMADIDDSWTNTAIFQPDLDPTTTTNPCHRDTDRDRLLDGEEDANSNGRLDAGETDPNVRDGNPRPLIGPYLLLL